MPITLSLEEGDFGDEFEEYDIHNDDLDELNIEIDEGNYVSISKRTLSIYLLHYAMEFPSPSHQPYVQQFYDHEVDIKFSYDDPEEVRKQEKEKASSHVRVSPPKLPKNIMWLIEYYNLDGKWLGPVRL